MADCAFELCILWLRVETAMRDVFDARYVSLHVRETNRAAIGLYRDTLGFEVHGVEKGYCESQINAFRYDSRDRALIFYTSVLHL